MLLEAELRWHDEFDRVLDAIPTAAPPPAVVPNADVQKNAPKPRGGARSKKGKAT
jgi:hypothetical protein